MSIIPLRLLYLIKNLHQTTTSRAGASPGNWLYLIKNLHQTTTAIGFVPFLFGCILSKIYIKPQPSSASEKSISVVSYQKSTSNHNYLRLHSLDSAVVSYQKSTSNHNREDARVRNLGVVSYQKSTSNHNAKGCLSNGFSVVSYQKSTSNHNFVSRLLFRRFVVSYQKSTSNHNYSSFRMFVAGLYLIKNLHQTTTRSCASMRSFSCILSKIYIKPQLLGTILTFALVVSYQKSTSNHNWT